MPIVFGSGGSDGQLIMSIDFDILRRHPLNCWEWGGSKMSTNQRMRLLVAAKDLVKVLVEQDARDEKLLPTLGALRFELMSACRIPGGLGSGRQKGEKQ